MRSNLGNTMTILVSSLFPLSATATAASSCHYFKKSSGQHKSLLPSLKVPIPPFTSPKKWSSLRSNVSNPLSECDMEVHIKLKLRKQFSISMMFPILPCIGQAFRKIVDDKERDVIRPPKVYHPDVWGDHFLSYSTNYEEELHAEQLVVLKDEVRKMLSSTMDNPLEHLKLIDAIERLGVAYHFKNEIKESLTKLFHYNDENGNPEESDLFYVSLKFRLLRQHGFWFTSDVFKKFTDGNGNFLHCLTSDVRGMLSLYEASYLRAHGEVILEKALSFTTYHLKTIATQSTHPLLEEVKRAMTYPLRQITGRLNARYELGSHGRHVDHSEALLKFATLDFNVFQSIYKKEIHELKRWSNDIGFAQKFPYSRDRIAEAYFWAAETLPEPKYSLGRIIYTKVFSAATALDDTYDSFGVAEEVEQLAEAFESWDESWLSRLPESMKLCYEAAWEVIHQAERDVIAAGMPNHVSCVLREIQALSRAYNEEFKWRETGDTLTYKEYMRMGVKNTGANVLLSVAYLAFGDEAKKEDFDWAYEYPKAVRALNVIGRLISDIVQHSFDARRGHVNALEAYMKEYDMSKEAACVDLYKKLDEAWIDLNEETSMHPMRPLSKNLLSPILSIAQIMNVVYNHEDGFGFVSQRIKDITTLLFIDEVSS